MTTAPVQPPNTSDEGEGLADPLLEHRIQAAADLARAEDRLRTAAMRAFRAWTAAGPHRRPRPQHPDRGRG
jgi:hypothetical protein